MFPSIVRSGASSTGIPKPEFGNEDRQRSREIFETRARSIHADMQPGNIEIATRFADALDAEAYDDAISLMADDCIYESPDGTLIGPEAIIDSYRGNGERASSRFDEITYRSQVERIGDEFAVTYFDGLRIGDRQHEFRCRQWLRVNADGRIIAIRHEEITGERERLRAFEQDET